MITRRVTCSMCNGRGKRRIKVSVEGNSFWETIESWMPWAEMGPSGYHDEWKLVKCDWCGGTGKVDRPAA